MKRYFILGIILLLVIPFVSAIPTTGAATLVGTNNATIECTGTTDSWYVRYGETVPGYWRTPDQAAGSTLVTIRGSLFGSSIYYFSCEDSTGSGSVNSFTTGVVTPLPTSHLGDAYRNITQNNYDLVMLGQHLVDPYRWSNVPLTLIFMLMFSPVFIGIWMRSKTVLVAMVFGFVISSFILFNNGSSGLGISMPPELIAICQAIAYISFAGAIVYVVHK